MSSVRILKGHDLPDCPPGYETVEYHAEAPKSATVALCKNGEAWITIVAADGRHLRFTLPAGAKLVCVETTAPSVDQPQDTALA